MEKVIGINLNGNAYQLEERGYEALLAYLDHAETQLAEDPDRAEIMADLEQAIAEKCNKVLGPHKTVVTAGEVGQILTDMGPVEGGQNKEADGTGTEQSAMQDAPKVKTEAPKRLYQIREGAMISGVCTGIAAYLDIDVTIVRIVFVILAVLTKGAWILAYVILMFVIPYATTSEERAVAHGRPFNAQDIIDQAKRNYANLRTNDWKRHWKRQRRHWRRQWRQSMPIAQDHAAHATQVLAAAAAPLFGLVNLALLILMLAALVSLVRTHAVFGWPLPSQIPVWVAFLSLIALYQLIAAPFISAHRAAAAAYGGHQEILIAPWAGAFWLLFMLFSLWYGYHHIPELRDFVQNVPAMWSDLVNPDR